MSTINVISGGITAAKGFTANGIHCGIRKNQDKKDLAFVFSEKRGAAAACYTLNKVKGAPIDVTRENISDGYAQAILCNSGNANTCNADGVEIAVAMCQAAAKAVDVDEKDIIIASTGVIGQPLPLDPILGGMKELVTGLSKEGGASCSEAILTTDTVKKEIAVTFECGGKTCTMGGIAKGSGMIHPNMATMLVFITTDVAICPELLQKALSKDIPDTFNMISVDGDTSTNDMVSILANGMAENPEITTEESDYKVFCEALNFVTSTLCKKIAKDGEGASKLLECNVTHAPDKDLAKKIAKSVITSNLFKCAMFGSDANWGRILCAIGYTEGDFRVDKIDVTLESDKGEILVCKDGSGVDFDEDIAKEILQEDSIQIQVNLNQGNASATAWGCDLTYDYVKINGDYRS